MLYPAGIELNSGNAVFKVTAGGQTAKCTVSVSSLRLNRPNASLLLSEETVDLIAYVSENGTEVNWSVEPAGVVTLVPQGDICTVIPVDNGTVTVTASAGPAKAICTIDSRIFIENITFITAVANQCSWTKESDGRVKLTAENRQAMAAVSSLDLTGKGLTDLSGIEWFTGLTTLKCSGNSLSELDVSNCMALTTLDCSRNQLASLDVVKNTALANLLCNNNQLSELDVSANAVLTNLDCSNNQLTELDVSKNTALTDLRCADNHLNVLNASDCMALKRLYCVGNQLNELNLSNCTTLAELHCNENQLTELDVSDCTALTRLYCAGNQLNELNVSNCTTLVDLHCNENQLTELDVSYCTTLITLQCYENRLTTLDVSGCTVLGILWCGGQTSDGATARTLTLMLTAEQKFQWDSSWENLPDNSSVNVVVAE